MTLEPVMLKITEDALEELITTYTRHTATIIAQTRERSLRRYRDGIVGETAAADRAACWLRLISIVEIYAEGLLLHLSQGKLDRPPGGWADVVQALRQRHGIDVTAVDGWERFDACVVVRNAVAHGLGRFTAKQVERNLLRKVRVLNIPVRDGVAVISSQRLADCVQACRAFISALDTHLNTHVGAPPSPGSQSPTTT